MFSSMNTISIAVPKAFNRIKTIGCTTALNDYEKRKLGVFNLLNFFGIVTGLFIPLAGLAGNQPLPPLAWIVAGSPFFIGITVLCCNYRQRYETGRVIYFTLYPAVTSLVYAANLDVGIELFFILYGVLSVFFLQRTVNIVFSFCFSVVCYLAVAVFHGGYAYRLQEHFFLFFVFNQVLAIVFIFAGLFMIKSENTGYQRDIIHKNNELEKQKIEIASKAAQLEKQAGELQELDALKNKLFSVIAHDLKTPMYALKNLFQNVQKYDLPGEEIKVMLPDIVTDLNYTTGLMENLLQWAKSQMKASAVNRELIDISHIVREVMQLLRLQAESKKIYLEAKVDTPVFGHADKDMVNLVLRNLLSNVIKFTPEKGSIVIGATNSSSFVEVYVQDSGTGISSEALQKINASDYYTTKGTANESGTGLGLMLCKEFLAKNGGKMFVESEPGKGSIFSFILPGSN